MRKSKCEQTRRRQRHAEPRGVASTSLHMRQIRGRPGTPGLTLPLPVPSAGLERGEDSFDFLGVKSLVEERGISGVSSMRGKCRAVQLLCFPTSRVCTTLWEVTAKAASSSPFFLSS